MRCGYVNDLCTEEKTLLTKIKDHPWVTKDGKDPLLSAEENTANLVEPPTEEEKNQAITGNLSNILVLASPSLEDKVRQR